MIPHSAIYMDMPWGTLLKSMPLFLKPTDRAVCMDILEKSFIHRPEKERLIATISVRTAFDLFFLTIDFPKGSEIIMTSINIPDMVTIVRYHGLKVVPVEIDVGKLAPTLEDIKKALTPKSKAIVLSYLYGAIYNIDEIVKFAHENNLYVLEDCAECFHDPKDNGNPNADLSLFSFGSIKLNTAFGGGLTVVKNNEVLYRKMKAMNESYEILPNKFFAKKIAKNLVPMVALNNPTMNKIIRHTANALNIDYKEAVVAMLRGFPPDDDFLPRFRKQMPDAMLALLAARMRDFDLERFERATQRQKDGEKILLDGGTVVPGHKADLRYFWLYPLIVPDVELCNKLLNLRGVDAYLGATQLDVVESPIGSKYKYPQETLEFFKHILYLPIHKNVPRESIIKICKEAVDVVNVVNNVKNKINTNSKL